MDVRANSVSVHSWRPLLQALKRFPPLASAIRYAHHRDLGDGDVLLASYPKSGSTWVQFMLGQLIAGREVDWDDLGDFVPMVNRSRFATHRLSSGGRLVKTHHPCIPSYRTPGRKAVYLVRDGRDVVVSYFHHQIREGTFDGSFDEFFDRFLGGRVDRYGTWSAHIRSWTSVGAPPSVLLLRYEDVLVDTVESLAKVCDFIELDAERSAIERVVADNRRDRMRAKETTSAWLRERHVVDGTFVRTDPSTTWRDVLRSDDVARFDLTSSETLDWLGYARDAGNSTHLVPVSRRRRSSRMHLGPDAMTRGGSAKGRADASGSYAGATLLVAAAGGHLKELHELRPRLAPTDNVVWATFDNTQSRSLLDGEDVHFVGYPQPRDIGVNARNMRVARKVLGDRRFDRVISTGSSIAVSFLPLAAAQSIPTHYIESAARAIGPSLTGRILRWVPRIRMYTQYPNWAGGPWCYGGSVFDGFEAYETDTRPIRRALVAVGTAEGYGFRPLVEAALRVLPDDIDVTWQTGPTPIDDLPIEGAFAIASEEFDRLLAEVDVVITHAGSGSSLAAFRAGAFPVLVPRRQHRREHVDDHQLEIADFLMRKGLALGVEAGDLCSDHLSVATSRRVRATCVPSPFELMEC